MLCTSRTSWKPLRTSRSGLKRAESGLVGSRSRQCENCERQPAVSCQFSPLMSWMTAEPGQVIRVGHHQADALAGARRSHGQHVLGAVVAQIAAVTDPEHDALAGEEPRLAHIGERAQRAEP